MHTRLRGGARARASSAHCCATVCERFERRGMVVFVYLSAEGRKGMCVCMYIRMRVGFPDLRVDIGRSFFFRMNVLRFFFLWIIADSFMII